MNRRSRFRGELLKNDRANQGRKVVDPDPVPQPAWAMSMDQRGEHGISSKEQAAGAGVVDRTHEVRIISMVSRASAGRARLARADEAILFVRSTGRGTCLLLGRVSLAAARVERLGPGGAHVVAALAGSPATGHHLLTTTFVAGESSLTTGVARFLAGPLVSGAFLMRRLSALARDLPLLGPIHRRKSA